MERHHDNRRVSENHVELSGTPGAAEAMSEQAVIKVAALTGGPKAPAARFRVRQYIPRLASRGIFVHEYISFFHENYGTRLYIFCSGFSR
jgi:hypothetical protein